uniref:Uncharacterized protein LOC105132860 isoform X3 n=1 Tax=Rhizophora mucronata TaxID=61149 RepID=A0A2P2K834_RHIMU
MLSLSFGGMHVRKLSMENSNNVQKLGPHGISQSCLISKPVF